MNNKEDYSVFEKFATDNLKFTKECFIKNENGNYEFRKTSDCFECWIESKRIQIDHARG